MTKDLILTIDVGTQSVRALAFDVRGELIAKTQIHIQPYFSDKPGWAEQHVSVFWDAIGGACRLLWDKLNKDRIGAVAFTSQRGTVVVVDEKGEPLRPAISWLDQRRTEGLKPVGGMWGFLFKLARATGTVAHVQAEAEINWIQTYQPEIWKKTHKILLLSGYLIYKLCGRFADSTAAQVAYLPFDYKKHDWASDSDWKWQVMSANRDQLYDLVPPAQTIGQISAEASEFTGIPKGLPLISAAADKACEIIGSGALDPHIGCLSYGTTATINTTHEKYVEVIPLIPPYPSAVPNRYSLEVQIFRGYWMVSWFKNQFGQHEQRIADERGIPPEVLFDELVRQVPAGSDGLILQPYWTPGIRYPGPEARGAIIGFSDVHTRAHIYRAILEGLAFALRDAAERTVRRSGVKITELRISGGGSQSDEAMQLTADIFNLPTSRPHTYETSGLGAAIDGAVGLGWHSDFMTAVKNMTRIERTFTPNRQNHEVYEELYVNVYQNMYKRLKPLCTHLRNYHK